MRPSASSAATSSPLADSASRSASALPAQRAVIEPAVALGAERVEGGERRHRLLRALQQHRQVRAAPGAIDSLGTGFTGAPPPHAGAGARRGLDRAVAAVGAGALAHHGQAEVPLAGAGRGGRVEPTAVVGDVELEPLAAQRVLHRHLLGVRVGVRVGECLRDDSRDERHRLGAEPVAVAGHPDREAAPPDALRRLLDRVAKTAERRRRDQLLQPRAHEPVGLVDRLAQPLGAVLGAGIEQRELSPRDGQVLREPVVDLGGERAALALHLGRGGTSLAQARRGDPRAELQAEQAQHGARQRIDRDRRPRAGDHHADHGSPETSGRIIQSAAAGEERVLHEPGGRLAQDDRSPGREREGPRLLVEGRARRARRRRPRSGAGPAARRRRAGTALRVSRPSAAHISSSARAARAARSPVPTSARETRESAPRPGEDVVRDLLAQMARRHAVGDTTADREW